jgi:hypothetical protein
MPITLATLDAQEATFARAFAQPDLTLARPLYDPAVIYLSPTVRLFDWPRRIEGIDRTLDFIALTIRRCESIDYRCVERALFADTESAIVRIAFDWTANARRHRSVYVVIYRYTAGRIAQQELYYDPSAPTDL